MTHRSPPLPALACLVALAGAAEAEDTALTIYSGDFDAVAAQPPGPGMPGFALVHATQRHALVAGDNVITLGGLPPAIDASGVRFASTTDDVRIAGQRFDFALADQSELLRRAVGRRVVVEQAIGAERVRFEGTLLAAGDGLTLALDDGRVRVFADYTGFELAQLPDGVRAQPTLRWNVSSARAAQAEFTLDYPTAGLAWRAEYVATLSGGVDACRMALDGAAQVLNRSGASFAAAQVTLVAGEPNRVPSSTPGPMMMAKSSRMEMMADGASAPQPSGEYHAYRLSGRTDVPDGSVQRVPLFAAADGVPCVRRYESRMPIAWFRPAAPLIEPDYGPTGQQPVQAMLEFANRERDGLGQPLPAGRLRVFERGDGGAEAFLGEARIEHTARGRELRVALGQSFDLSLERTREELRLDDDRRGLQERIALVLRNAKPQAATIRAIETLPRWSDWEIVEADAKWTRIDAQTIAFDVAVPADGEATVRYAVRYRWPDPLPH